jgi:hypothetical protein
VLVIGNRIGGSNAAENIVEPNNVDDNKDIASNGIESIVTSINSLKTITSNDNQALLERTVMIFSMKKASREPLQKFL